MVNINEKKVIIIFANTLWFLEKFKYDLIISLSHSYTIKCLYLRDGPSINNIKINLLKERNVSFKKIDLIFVCFSFISNLFRIQNKYFYSCELRSILVYTIGPILLSPIIFVSNIKSTIFVLEGLGRIFSSRIIIYRILKRFIQFLYKILFSYSKYIVTLNYSDARYLLDFGIVSITKIRTIPGTGVNINYLDSSLLNNPRDPKYIDYIARLLPEKGFYQFVFLRQYILKFNKYLSKSYLFRVITPQSDIDKLSVKELKFYKNLGILIKPYLPDTYNYYKESKVIIMPTSYGEGLSRVLLEAIYLGIPLILSRNPGTEEILPFDYKYFLLSNNPCVLSGQLSQLINDTNYFDRISKKQRDLIKTYYSTDKSNQVLYSLLD